MQVPVIERESATTRLIDLLTPQNSVHARRPRLGAHTADSPGIAAAAGERSGRRERVVGCRIPQQGQLQAGDIIYALNGKPIGSIAELKAAAEALKPSSAAVLQIERDGG